MNTVLLSGRLIKEPELKYLTEGKAVATFMIAVSKGLSKEKRKEFEENKKTTAEFIKIIAYDKTAGLVARYLHKGSQVIVLARIHIERYEKEEKYIYVTQIIAQTIEFIGNKIQL